MALLRISQLSLVLVFALSCTDSQLDGVPRVDLDGYAETDGTSIVDTAVPDTAVPDTDLPDTVVLDTVAPDTVAPDTVTPDTTDVAETDAGCTTNESCRSAVGPLSACQDPVCSSGQCRVAQRADCCVISSDCPRLDDACLSNRCPVPGGGCVALNICNACTSNIDCASNDPCTIGRCEATGECAYTRNPACEACRGDADCNDQVACTNDACVDGRCIHEATPGCCTLDSDCRDQDPCTRDFCRPGSGICGFEQIPGCSNCTPELCDDFNPCTQDLCTDIGCAHITDPDCRGCQGNGQCNDNDPCTRDQCANGRCTYTPAAGPDGTLVCACTDAASCDDGDPCTRDVCQGQQCLNLPDPTAPNCGDCGGSCDDLDPCTVDSCDGFNCQHRATPDVAGCDGRCRSDADCGGGDMCSRSFCDPMSATCTTISVPDCCQSNAMCDDQDPCTDDACTDGGRCVHRERPGCGLDCQQSCDDGDPCTTDLCVPGSTECISLPIPGCTAGCNNDADCEDASECTLNTCVAGTCKVAAIPDCCNNNNDCRDGDRCTDAYCQRQSGTCIITFLSCDDGNPCTIDACDSNTGGCTSVPDLTSAQCQCQPTVLWTRRFTANEAPDINIDGSGFGVRWQVDDVRSFSANESLRYGDDNGEDYNTNFRTFGRATGPTLSVPVNAGRVTLAFMVYLDIDADPARDSFRARVLYGNQNEIAWDRVSVGPEMFGRWFPVQVTLPQAVVGRQIQIRFVFDSIDGEGNAGQGVFVDDIVVQTSCP